MTAYRQILRFALGAYLCCHFVQLVPYAVELFSDAGMVADAAASPFFGRVPNPLFVRDEPWAVVALVAWAAVASLLLAFGVRERVAALALWVISAFLYTRNPLIANPAAPFIGLLLLVYACFPARAHARTDLRAGSPYGLVFIVMAVAYSYSGLTKLASPSWLDGSALRYVLENPLARPGWARELLLAAPDFVLAAMTYGVLALEILFAPLSLSRRMRPLVWTAMTVMHAGILLLVDFADLTLGMLIVHAYTFDPAWLRGRAARSAQDHVGMQTEAQPALVGMSLRP